MSTIDEPVVSMQFDTGDFNRGVESILQSLELLRSSIDFSGAVGGVDELQSELDSVNISAIADGIDSISEKFSAMGAIAFSVLSNITSTAIDSAKTMFSGTLGQILSGGAARSLAIEQARFQFEGLGLDVEAMMASALEAVQGTAYGLDQAAGIAAQFGSAGIQAGDELTGALRGVAGIAAQTGSRFEDIGLIMTQMAAIGHVTSNDLISFQVRNLGVVSQLADAYGTTEEVIREMVTNGEISFREFAQFADNAFGAHAQDANKTYTGSLDNLHAAMNRLGEVFATPRFAVLRLVFNTLAPAIDRVKEAAAPLVETLFHLERVSGFRFIQFLQGIRSQGLERVFSNISHILHNVVAAVKSFVKPIRAAFGEIFGKIQTRDIINVLHAIREFTNGLRLSSETGHKVRNIFQGVFSVFSILREVFLGIVHVVGDVISSFSGVGGGILQFASKLGKLLTDLEAFLVDGGRISDFFDNLGESITNFLDGLDFSGPVEFLTSGLQGLIDIFHEITGAVGEGDSVLGRVQQRYGFLANASTVLGNVWDGLVRIFEGFRNVIGTGIDYIQDKFSGLGDAIRTSVQRGDFNEVLDLINVTFLGGIALAIRHFMKSGVISLLGDDFVEHLTAPFDALTETLKTMQLEIKSRAILNIGKAIAILTASVFLLSLIDSADLTKALTAMTVGFSELVGVFALLDKMAIGPKAAQMVTLSIGLSILAGAMILMSFAVRSFAKLNLGELAIGLTGMGVALLFMVKAAEPLAEASVGLSAAGAAMILMGIALNIIAVAVKIFATMDWGELARGLTGLAGGLIAIIAVVNAVPSEGMIATGVGLLLISGALVGIAASVKLMSGMDWGEIARGLAGLGTALLGLVGALKLIGDADVLLGAVALGIVSAGLVALAFAMNLLGNMSMQEIGRGLTALALSLLAIGAAGAIVAAFPELALGIAALGVALVPLSFGLILLTDAIQGMSDLSWGDIAKGLGAITVALVVIGALATAGTIFGVTESMIVLGIALALIGAGFALTGAGIYLFAAGLEKLIQLGPEAVDAMKSILEGIISLIPDMMSSLAEGVIGFIQIILEAAPEIVEGIIGILGDVLAAIPELAPQFAEAFGALIQAFLDVVVEKTPEIVETGFQLIISFMQGIRDHIVEICNLAFQIVERLAGCILENVWQIIAAAAGIVGQFISGVIAGAAGIVAAGARMIGNVVSGIASGIGGIISAAAQAVGSFVGNIAGAAGRFLAAGAGIIAGVISGIASGMGNLISSALQTAGNFVTSLASGLLAFIGNIIGAAARIGQAIVDGIINAIRNAAGAIADAVTGVLGGAIDAIGGFIGSPFGCPSRLFMEIGGYTMEGLVIGIQDKQPDVERAMIDVGEGMAESFNNIGQKIASSLAEMNEFNPKISPVLDLTQLKEDAQGINDIFGNPVAGVSSGQAQAISLGTKTQGVETISGDKSGATEVKFEQNIYAPKQLSTGDIYRQTKSQITLAKEELRI